MTRRLEDVVAQSVAEHTAAPVDAEALLAATTARAAGPAARRPRPVLLVAAAAVGVAAVVAGVWLLGGRAASGTAPRQPAASGAPSPSPSPRDCGSFVLGQGDRPPATAHACLLDAARDGVPAVLVVTMPTVEGDPITTTYAVVGPDTVRVVTDSSKDSFAGNGPAVLQQLCKGPSTGGHALLGFASCSEPEPASSPQSWVP